MVGTPRRKVAGPWEPQCSRSCAWDPGPEPRKVTGPHVFQKGAAHASTLRTVPRCAETGASTARCRFEPQAPRLLRILTPATSRSHRHPGDNAAVQAELECRNEKLYNPTKPALQQEGVESGGRAQQALA
eukprot:1929564-Pyramimonas_sp.AAC.1